MKASLGDSRGNLGALRKIQENLLSVDRRAVDAERWGTLSQIAECIADACGDRDLVRVVAAVRDMKNKLRRPSIQRALKEVDEKTDDNKESNKKKSDGTVCRCEQCDVELAGVQAPCIEGTLCPECALVSKSSKSANDEKAARKSAAKAGSPAGDDKMSEGMSSSLRLRRYDRV